MRKNYYLFPALLFFFSWNIYPQAPFTTMVKEPVYIEKVDNKYQMIEESTFNSKAAIMAAAPEKIIKTEPKEDVDFFKNNSLALSIIKNGENRLSANSQVLFYKIYAWTRVKDLKYRFNLPVMLISKLSTSYDSIKGSNAIDVLDYEAAPVTLRIMPSWKISCNKTYKEKVLFGFYADARGINMHYPQTDSHQIEVIGSGGLGFTFQGDGETGFYNSEGEYEAGKWLLSVILQGSTGKDQVIQSLFKTEKDYVTSFQSYFTFRVSENNKFNLKISYQHYFQETISGSKNNFSIGIGM